MRSRALFLMLPALVGLLVLSFGVVGDQITEASLSGPIRFPTTWCPTPIAMKSPGPTALPSLLIDRTNNGQEISLHKTQILQVSLDSSPSTGYTWQVELLDEQVLAQRGDSEFIPGTLLPGSSGTEVFHFEAIAAGRTPLRLSYDRHWAGGLPPTEVFLIQVIVL